MIRIAMLLLAFILPVSSWIVSAYIPLTLHEKCYSESVYVFREPDRDVIRVSRFWLNNDINHTSGSYHASLLFYSHGELNERKEIGRTLSYATQLSAHALHMTLSNVNYLSGIDDGDSQYSPYFDPYLRKGFRSDLHFFKTSSGKILTGLEGRPRAICTVENTITYPLR